MMQCRSPRERISELDRIRRELESTPPNVDAIKAHLRDICVILIMEIDANSGDQQFLGSHEVVTELTRQNRTP